jgi:hypothetical protein
MKQYRSKLKRYREAVENNESEMIKLEILNIPIPPDPQLPTSPLKIREPDTGDFQFVSSR